MYAYHFPPLEQFAGFGRSAIYHASGVTRGLPNQLIHSGTESAGFAGLKWMYQGIDPKNLFQ